MKKIFRKIGVLLMMLIIGFGLVSCDKKTPEHEEEKPVIKVVVTFDSLGGSEVPSFELTKDGKVSKPKNPTKKGFNFEYWYLTDENEEFDFNISITENITLQAFWTPVELTALEKIEEDYQAILESFVIDETQINTVTTGPINKSKITWRTQTPYISNSGVVLPLLPGAEPFIGVIGATFRLGGEKVEYEFEVPIDVISPVLLHEKRTFEFENLTTEYEISDGTLDLWFEENGSIPYVNVENFFNLIEGFIDPETVITFTQEEGVLTIFYQYYDEDEDYTYDLTCVIDSVNQTITTPDPGFYWAYVYSTETNYGRHIEYLRDYVGESSVDGTDLVYDLTKHNLEIVYHGGEILLPFSLTNQLFAGNSYFNVYYNGDKLYGIFSLPEKGTLEYNKMKTATANETSFPVDLVIHNFNSLAFFLDNFYGLKEYFEIESFYPILSQNASSLLSLTPIVYENGLGNLLLKVIDEPHTSYGYASYYSKLSYTYPTDSLGNYGPRFNSWYMNGFSAVNDVIEAKWGRDPDLAKNAWAANSKTRPKYWFLDDTHAVIILDSFKTQDIEESFTYEQGFVDKIMKVEEVLIPAITEGNKFFFYNTSDHENRKMEVIIRGVLPTYLETYKQALVDAGFNYHFEEGEDADKETGYYTKEISGKPYMVIVDYNEEHEVFYLGLMDKVPESYEMSWPFYAEAEKRIYCDSAVFLEFTLDKIFVEQPGVTHITLDITWNTGGNVGALYRVVGFITSEPFKTTRLSAHTGSKSTSYIKITGLKTYPPIKWSLLTSPLTYSAGNSLATIFKENELGPIIGMTTGGGTSSITPVLLPNGSAFTMSGNSMNGYRTGLGTDADPYEYHINEDGITPDYEITYSQFYDEVTLLEILNAHYKK